MKNQSNTAKYRRLAPFYDLLMGNSLFRQARQKAFSMIEFPSSLKVLLTGVGTGEDIALLSHDIHITGIDLSAEMLRIAAQKAGNREARLLEMNAEQLTFADNSLHLQITATISLF
ncbi:methyltransferase domain-containing protein [Bacillus tianshenii]|nr:methyltransferase domain-containing protein [Bacillus tianshenii]